MTNGYHEHLDSPLHPANKSFPAIIRTFAKAQPEKIAFTFLENGEDREISLTYGQLFIDGERIASTIQQITEPDARVLLIFPPGLDFIRAFVACLLAGRIAVPVYPPARKENLTPLVKVAQNCTASLLLAPENILSRDYIQEWLASEKLNARTLEAPASGRREALAWANPQPNRIAFLQYSSGSLGNPKGVRVSHQNLLHNQELIRQQFKQNRNSVIVSWLPFYHDMGLIGNVLHTIYLGARCVLLAPVHFLLNPLRWLRAIAHYRATTSGGPDFAYRLCTERILENEISKLDLSSWKTAYNGAEPIQAKTLRNFAKKFALAGFRAESFHPCYGLAEATLLVSTGKFSAGTSIQHYRRAAFEDHLDPRAEKVPELSEDSFEAVACGKPQGHEVLIVGRNGEVLPESSVGEIWLRGSSIAEGYWNDADHQADFAARTRTGTGSYFKTGDLGWLADGQLFIGGRIKELIIIRGKNFYPQDLEAEIFDCHPAILPGRAAAFSILQEEEQLVLALEVKRKSEAVVPEIFAAILACISGKFQLHIESIALLRQGTLPRTTSGKIKRLACRQQYLEGSLQTVASWPSSSRTPVSLPANEIKTPQARKLAELFQDILGIDTCDLSTSFFASGGDSLKAVYLADAISREFNIETGVQDLFQYPVLSDLDRYISEQNKRKTAPGDSQEHEFVPRSLTSAQMGIWFHQQFTPDTNAYNIPVIIRVADLPELPALQKALDGLVAEHEIFRYRFQDHEGQPRIQIAETSSISIATVPQESAENIGYWGKKTFDLENGPLLRLVLFQDSGALLLVVHHLISDGQGVQLFLTALQKRARAIENGSFEQPQILPYQYHNFAQWQNQRNNVAAQTQAKAYWHQQLAQAIPGVQLPTDFLPASSRPAGASEIGLLSLRHSQLLTQLAHQYDSSLFMVLLAGFRLLMHRFTGQKDMLIGSPVTGRTQENMRDLPGLMLATTLLRIPIDPESNFIELLQNTRKTVLGAIANQAYPFHQMVEDLGLWSNPQSFPGSSVFFNGLTFAKDQAGSGYQIEFPALGLDINFDLNCYVAPAPDGSTRIRLDYRKSIFKRETIQQLIGAYSRVLEQSVENPQLAIRRLECFPKLEHSPKLAQPQVENIVAAVSERASLRKSKTAIWGTNGSISYGELMHRATGLATLLCEKNKGQTGILIAILTDDLCDFVTAALGVLKAGGIYVPLDPAYPNSRLQHIVDRAAPQYIIASAPQHAMASQLLPGNHKVIDIHDTAAEQGSSFPALHPDSAAYMLFTSGTTGGPKGILQQHGNVLHFVRAYIQRLGIEPDNRLSLFSAFSFDAAVVDIFSSLLAGATLYHLPYQRLGKEGIRKAILDHRLNIWHSTPALYRDFLHQSAEETAHVLKVVVLGGEHPGNALVAKHFEVFPELPLVNLYGQSESSISALKILHQADASNRLTLGTPIAGTQMWVARENGTVAASYEAGEITLHSPYVSPTFATPDTTFSTGDLGRQLSDGSIEFLGRKDDQVKIRGFRIELQEIVQNIEAISGVRQAAVFPYVPPGEPGILAAWLVTAPQTKVQQVQDALATKLPAYMQPNAWMLLPELPTTPNGKVDRKALPPPKQALAQAEFIPPQSELEKALAAIWKSILGLQRISVNDHFFQLGGHSLKASQVRARIQSQLGLQIPFAALFSYPRLGELATYLGSIKTTVVPTETGIPKCPQLADYPLSHAQKRIWLLTQSEAAGLAYNIQHAFKLTGLLHVEAMEKAFSTLVQRHAALRTSIHFQTGEVRQVIGQIDSKLVLRDFSQAKDAELTTMEFIRSEINRPFSKLEDGLFRVYLLRISPDSHILFFNVHHMGSDAWSMNILMEEWTRLYAKYTSGQAAPISKINQQYHDYAVWHNTQISASAFEEDLEHWRSQYAHGVPSLNFPLDRPRGAKINFQGGAHDFDLPAPIYTKLQQLAMEHHTSINAICFAAYSIVLANYSGQSDFPLGIVVAGREHPDTEPMVGLFVNFLPVRCRIASDQSFAEYLQVCHQSLSQALEHSRYPFDLLANAIQPDRDPARNPIFDTLLVFHNAAVNLADASFANIQAEPIPLPQQGSTLDFRLEIWEKPDHLDCRIEFNTWLFEEATAIGIATNFRSLMEQIANAPSGMLADFTKGNLSYPPTLPEAVPASETTLVHFASTFTDAPLLSMVAFWSDVFALQVQTTSAPYNQIFQQLIDDKAEFRNNRGINVLLIRFEDWLRDSLNQDQARQEKILADNFAQLTSLIVQYPPQTEWLVPLFAASPAIALQETIEKMNKEWEQFLSRFPQIHILQTGELAQQYGLNTIYDPQRDKIGHLPFTELWFSALGKALSRKVVALQRPAKKVIVLDCDNTLWDGICGEDGPQGVQVTQAHIALQQFCLDRREAGFLLCLNSKNNEADAWAVFSQNPGMLLKKDDFVAHRINWQPKSGNLRELAKELNLGLDSFIFIDDSPVECAEVRQNAAAVFTLQIPPSTADYAALLSQVWAFDKVKVTAEDRLRSDMYKQENLRKAGQQAASSMDDFLANLKLKVDLVPLAVADLDRAAQLTQRTNQFNLSTRRRTAAELQTLVEDPNWHCWRLLVEDRYGSYGTTGLVLIHQNAEIPFLDTFLLSCRVLGRGVEHAMIGVLASHFLDLGQPAIATEFISSARNQPIREFIEQQNWALIHAQEDRMHYQLPLKTLTVLPSYIQLQLHHTPLNAQIPAPLSPVAGGSSNSPQLDEKLPGTSAPEFPPNTLRWQMSMPPDRLPLQPDDQVLKYVTREGLTAMRHDVQIQDQAFPIEARLLKHPAIEAIRTQASSDTHLPLVRLQTNSQVAFSVQRLSKLAIEAPEIFARCVQLPNRLSMVQHNPLETQALYEEIFISHTYLRFGIQLEEGNTVIDVGAHIGMASLYFATACPGLRIFALEPRPEIYAILKVNSQLYDFDIRPVPTALSQNPQPAGNPAGGRENVSGVLKLSDLLDAHGIAQVDLLKISSGNHAWNVLQEMQAADWRKIRQIILEIGGQGKQRQICELLQSKGFSVEVENQATDETSKIFATRERAKRSPFQPQVEIAKFLCNKWFHPERLIHDLYAELGRHFHVSRLPERYLIVGEPDLLAPGWEHSFARNTEPPRNEIESQIHSIWSHVLGLDKIGIADNFFAIGGNSLRVVTLYNMIEQAFPGCLKIGDMFDVTTIAAQAEMVSRETKGTEDVSSEFNIIDF